MSISDIIKAISGMKSKFVILTGGEPTLQINEELISGSREIRLKKYNKLIVNMINIMQLMSSRFQRS